MNPLHVNHLYMHLFISISQINVRLISLINLFKVGSYISAMCSIEYLYKLMLRLQQKLENC